MGRPKPNLTDRQRDAIFSFLNSQQDDKNKKNGLKNGTIRKAAKQFKCSADSVRRIWSRVKIFNQTLDPNYTVHSRKKKKCGRKITDRSDKLAMMPEIPMRRRQTVRSLSAAIGVTKSTLHRMLKREEIKRVSNRLKPLLTPENETQRVQFVMDQISAENGEFINLTKKVHVDEKNGST